MNKKCLECGAYIREQNICRIVHWRPIDELNINGRCGFYDVYKLPQETLSEKIRRWFRNIKQQR